MSNTNKYASCSFNSPFLIAMQFTSLQFLLPFYQKQLTAFSQLFQDVIWEGMLPYGKPPRKPMRITCNTCRNGLSMLYMETRKKVAKSCYEWKQLITTKMEAEACDFKICNFNELEMSVLLWLKALFHKLIMIHLSFSDESFQACQILANPQYANQNHWQLSRCLGKPHSSPRHHSFHLCCGGHAAIWEELQRMCL